MEASTRRNKLALYFHIPFCTRKCGYCGFLSLPVDTDPEARSRIEPVLERTLDEFRFRYDNLGFPPAETVYIGGGTPSVVPVDILEGFIRKIDETVSGTIREWTVEVNPESLDSDLLAMFEESPVNRLSMGIQSASPRLLELLGRNGSRKDIYRAAALLEKYWRGRLSIDLMHGLPGQDETDVFRALELVADLNAEHISLYSLTVEAGTPLSAGILSTDEERDIRIWRMFDEGLQKMGFRRYEISSYARGGAERAEEDEKNRSLHNLKYWRYEPYLGCGPGAHSTVVTGEGTVRIENTSDILNYLDPNKHDFGAYRIVLNERERLLEFLLMGFRLTEGIRHTRFEELFRSDFRECFSGVLQEWVDEGFAVTDDDRTALTERGIWIMNTLLVRMALEIDEIIPA